MPVSINNTQVVFNDATTKTTSGVTSIGTGTGISSTGGKTPTLTNTGVTSVSGAGTVSVSASSGAVTITGGGLTSAVTSVATGNGLQGGTITTSGTLSVACPGFNTVGSYVFVGVESPSAQFAPTSGSNYSAGTGNGMQSALINAGPEGVSFDRQNNLSGTWKWMGSQNTSSGNRYNYVSLACRVS